MGIIKHNNEVIMVITKVQKWGNSLAVRIPKEIAEHLEIVQGSDIEIKVSSNDIRLVPTKHKPTLEKLMAQITPENQHNEIGWGRPHK